MNKKIKILFLASEPTDLIHLELGKECERIKREIELEANRDRFEVIQHFAVTPRELIRALDRHQPHIVHFSGHGGTEGIILEDEAGNHQVIPKAVLAELLQVFKKSVSLVFLNACYSESQAQAFSRIIDFTVGMRRQVGDKAAISFASAFYGGLSFGHSVKEAFTRANILLGLNQSPDKDNPHLLVRRGVDRTKPFLEHISFPAAGKRSGGASTNGDATRGKMPDQPQACLWVHGWVKRLYDCFPTVELDWTDYFRRSGRDTPGPQVWNRTLFDELQAAKKRLDRRDPAAFIDFRGKLPLTALLAVGANFPEVGGYRLRAEQPTQGKTVLWRSDAAPSKRWFKIVSEKQAKGSRGQGILIGLGITGSALKEVTALYKQYPQTFSAMIYAEPDSGTGDGALRSDCDAVALAVKAKDLIRECKLEYEPKKIHLVVYGPAAYCLFLGQRLNALGNIVTYERSADGDYKQSAILQTE